MLKKKEEQEALEAQALLELSLDHEHDAVEAVVRAVDKPQQQYQQRVPATEEGAAASGSDHNLEEEVITQMRKVMTTSQRRYVSSLLQRVKILYEKRGMSFPGLCTCSQLSRRSSPAFWMDCANDCPFFRNPKACCQSLRMICSGFAAHENGLPQCQPAWG
jgi:hypothetical protein